MAAWIKQQWPDCHITFLCRNYTAPIVQCYEGIDSILLLEEIEALPATARPGFIANKQYDLIIHVFPRKELAQLFKKAKVKDRIGTSHRGYHLLTCNLRPNFSRKRSAAHEAQLNFELLRPLGLSELPSMETLTALTSRFRVPQVSMPDSLPLNPETRRVILHPKSQGSALEWPIARYVELAEKLVEKGFTVYFTGTEKEGAQFRDSVPWNTHCIDTTGTLDIAQLLWLIHESYGLVACSTGPLHLAGYMGIHAVGLYSPRIPIHPGRWKPLGTHATALVFDPLCPACGAKKACNCIEQIPVERVLEHLQV